MASRTSAIRFGIFTVDYHSGELFRHDHKVKLQRQPFQVLALLLENAGQLVTREEIRKRLWPDNSFGDFEGALNKAINGLRAALRDHARKPRFIETLPSRGYRFIAPVEAPGAGSTRIDSLAVLPLDNFSGDPAEEYFADGMTEELIYAVSRIRSLRVISRTSVMQYKGARRPLMEIARELGVDAIIEGSIGRSGSRVKVTAQLIYAPQDKHLWSGKYEREDREILLLQSEIARDIAVEIHKLAPAARDEQQIHPQAFEARLKGVFFRDKMNPGSLEKSLSLFATAIELDSTYAQAYADLSQAYFYLGLFGVHEPAAMFAKARANATLALRLDETVATAHNALAVIHVFQDWDWHRAETELRRAVELNPGQAVTHVHLADYMSIRGRHEEAIEEFGRVLKLAPIATMYLGHFGLILYRARRYRESVAQCEKALDLDPNYANAMWFMALSLEQMGEQARSIAALEKAASLSPAPQYRSLLGRAYALAGERAKALTILAELETVSAQRYVSPIDLAIVNAGLDERDTAFRWLEEAYRQRSFRIIELTMPIFDALRPDPRWQDLVRRIGLVS